MLNNRIILFAFISLIVCSCSYKNKKNDDFYYSDKDRILEGITDSNGLDANKQKICRNPEKLIITKRNLESDCIFCLDYTDNYELSDPTIISAFEGLFNQKLAKDYPLTIPDYSISYYCQNKKYLTRQISTQCPGDSIQAFFGFDPRSKIKRSDWNSFMNNCVKITTKDFHLNDLITARQIVEYCDSNSLPIIIDEKNKDTWKIFDGEFVFSIALKQKRINSDAIYDLIKLQFPNSQYRIIKSKSKWDCKDETGENCVDHATYTVYCNQEFYDNFAIPAPKSSFKKYNAIFKVLGSPKNLAKIEKMVN